MLIQEQGRVDQRDMGQRLREVSGHATHERIIFFGEQTDIIAQQEEALEQGSGVVPAACQRIGVG
ncbi:hypothetical protein [Cupriavidus numazuensis]|uniref:hypothetical protein n=1 Tax=Cupriavidus numazuensis TaxID=221992 RepID=UPI003618176E